MRALVALLALAGCDRVFGLGDPYQDARTVPSDGVFADSAGPHDAATDTGPPTPSAVGHWAFDGDLMDSVSGVTGTCVTSDGVGCAFEAGRHGQALKLDGANCARLDFANPLPAFSIVAWLDPASGGGAVLDRPVSNNLPSQDSWFISVTSNTINYTTLNAAGDDDLAGNFSVPNGVWTNLETTFDTNAKTIVVNGLEVGRENGPMAVLYGSSTSLFVGCHEAASQVTYYAGDIDDLYIFDHALTTAELAAIL